MVEYIFYYLFIGVIIQTLLDYPLGGQRRGIWIYWPITVLILIYLFIITIIAEIKAGKK